MFAGNHELDNLVVIVDNNSLQIDGPITEVNSPYPIDGKFRRSVSMSSMLPTATSFDQLRAAFKEAHQIRGKPTAIIAKTVKGWGVPLWRIRSAGTARHRMIRSTLWQWQTLRKSMRR